MNHTDIIGISMLSADRRRELLPARVELAYCIVDVRKRLQKHRGVLTPNQILNIEAALDDLAVVLDA